LKKLYKSDILYLILFIKEGENMRRKFTLEYWIDEGWYVGRLKEIPGVFSQGENLEELKENIIDAYKLVMSEGKFELEVERKETEIEVEV